MMQSHETRQLPMSVIQNYGCRPSGFGRCLVSIKFNAEQTILCCNVFCLVAML
ncbi:hypothetical protein [Lambdina fiscellaria nucleopolyhedrovirus]|uniref:Uncharacterized protein n=1 Tax=Lambdina fiscellaria nucleopolyhedrovirus TaxID=1642929 RepID=A0A0E3Z600_9ABAC|nr:hypothetical protein [Lambdina fiscellaria nucleopolyhedrovirus]AKC91653.1 hypothetical protein [Lambdina fiscellaria nucleopolyhedrovirus]